MCHCIFSIFIKNLFVVNNGTRLKYTIKLIEGVNNDNWVQGILWNLGFVCEHFAFCTLFGCLNAVVEKGRPKVTSTSKFLGSINS
jgi:hypothetical protein